jgi:hypothetical protein
MGLSDILAGGIAIADSATKDVQPFVTHEAWTGQDEFGSSSYAAPVLRQAIVDLTRHQVATGGGLMVTVVATVTFLEAVAANGAADRKEPIDPRDVITLSDGTTGPILNAPDSVVNPQTGLPFYNKVMIGEQKAAP